MAGLNVIFVFSLIFACVVAQHDHHDHSGHNHEEHRVNVGVYYESLCPDSKKFFTQQLYPSLQGNLSKFVNLTLVPYGKTTTNLNSNNNIEFTCHHGPGECNGNKIQACALHLIDGGKPTEGLGFNRVAVGFINCLMDRSKRNGDTGDFPTTECANLNHVTVLSQIETCVNSTDASNYLSHYGSLTDAVQKPIKGVPTVVFNGQLKEADNSLAYTNFVKALCQYIPKGEKPAECSGANVFNVSMLFLVLSSFISRLF